MPFATSHGAKIHYEVEGSGLPLVLQHGGWGCIEDWYEFGHVDRLKKDFQLILIDARACGKSDKPHDPEQYSPQIHADDIAFVLDELKVAKCHFLGFSLGGRIGYWMCRFHPQRLLSLIILGASPYAWDMSPLINVTKTLDEWVPDDPDLSEKQKLRWLDNDKQAIIASMSYSLPDDSHVFRSVNIPYLMMCGEHDGDLEDSKRSAAENLNVTFVQLEGLNHPDTLFRSDILAPHVLQFISSIR